jgi:amino acid permease
VHPIRAELSKTSDMKTAVRVSLVLCAAIYAAVGFFGYLLFGDATMADVLANFDRSSGAGVPQALNDAARLSYALHLVLVFPLLLFSLRVNVDELLFPGRRPLATDTRRFVSLTVVLMAVLYALAIAIPSIWTLFEYSGSTFAVTISLIFPGAIVLRYDGQILNHFLHCQCYASLESKTLDFSAGMFTE